MAAYLRLPGGKEIPVSPGMVFGRGADAEVVLHDAQASRRHAQLIVHRGVIEIEDLGSSNGTRLNGHRVSRRSLADGDEIKIGATTIRFCGRVGDAAVEPGEESVEELFADDDVAPHPVESVEVIRRAPPHPYPTAPVTPLSFAAGPPGLSRRARALLVVLALAAVAGLLYLIVG